MSNIPQLVFAVGVAAAASIVIKYACDSYDDAASYISRGWSPGIKGATILAIGSSLPELFTAMFLLFLYHDADGFSAAIATCAGSGVFNALIIPGLCVLAVTWWGRRLQFGEDSNLQVWTDKGHKAKKMFSRWHVFLPAFDVDKKVLIRDGLVFIFAEALLVGLLSGSTMYWWMGAVLLAYYAVYVYRLVKDNNDDVWEPDDYEHPTVVTPMERFHIGAWARLDFNRILFNREYNTFSAWTVLACATAVISAACYLLAGAVVDSANALGVAPYFTAVVLGAAATSVPDTFLSIKAAVGGDPEDAISNAFGSNTFDVTVALGLPLFLYGLVYGDVSLSASGTAADVQILRIALLALTGVGLFVLVHAKKITAHAGAKLLVLYGAWCSFILYRAMIA